MAENLDRDELPQAIVAPKRRARISVVWIVPIFAAVVAAGIAIHNILSEGPTITITFTSAEGVEAGKTFIKYKDVNIGQVTAVQLSNDYTKVTVTAKIAKSAEGLIVEDAKFWVVEPRVTLSGVSGLGTLLSGNYIGFETGTSSKQQHTFVGLEVAPVITLDQPGRQFILQAENLSSLGVGSPVYYHRLQAGQVIAYNLAGDGKAIEVKVFVNAPYDQYVTPETRFWNASGVDVSVGADGVEVRTQSLVALLAGGLAFDTPSFAPTAESAVANTVFTLYADRTTAMKQPDPIAKRYVLYFDESLRGLSVGAPVTLLGLPGGEVTDVGLVLDPTTLNLRGRVEVIFFPERIIGHLQQDQASVAETIVQSEQERHTFVQQLVEQRGLRAQLQSGSLLTGQLYVALDYFPDAPQATIDWSQDPTQLPVIPSTLLDVEAKLSSIIAKFDQLPYEAIGDDLKKALVSLDQMLKAADRAVNRLDEDLIPALQTTLDGLHGTIVTADGVLKNADATLVGEDAPAQQELRIVLQEVARAARSLRILSDFLERHPESLLRGKNKEKP